MSLRKSGGIVMIIVTAAVVLLLLIKILGGGGPPGSFGSNGPDEGHRQGAYAPPSGDGSIQQKLQKTADARDAISAAREAVRSGNVDAARRALETLRSKREGLDPMLQKDIDGLLESLKGISEKK